MQRSVQASNELEVFDKLSGLLLASDHYSLSFLLNGTKKKPAEWKEDLLNAKDEEKVLLDNIRSLEPKIGATERKEVV